MFPSHTMDHDFIHLLYIPGTCMSTELSPQSSLLAWSGIGYLELGHAKACASFGPFV